ncbi:hypothetical protein NST83_21070 [Paenibacillus sp. FSL R10-2782]|uniref:hypothetical protein n=1 Tax=Paenibacillus sp. FSL R10-2782 TaxID=2954661 RepID=UPI0031598AEC
MGRHHATICREICRNATQNSYEAGRSQQAYEHRHKASLPKGKWTQEQAAQIEEKLHATWLHGERLRSLASASRHWGKLLFTTGEEKGYNKAKVSLNQNNCINAKMIIILIAKHAASGFPKQHVLFLGT